MNIAVIIATILLIIAVNIYLICFADNKVNGLYMYIFEHKEWNTWGRIEKNLNDYTLVYNVESVIKFANEHGDEIMIFGDYASIFYKGECLCSSFWRSKSKNIAKKLLEKIN